MIAIKNKFGDISPTLPALKDQEIEQSPILIKQLSNCKVTALYKSILTLSNTSLACTVAEK